MSNIYCSECGGDQNLGCDCSDRMTSGPVVVEATIQDLMMSHKLDHEDDDEYDVGKDY